MEEILNRSCVFFIGTHKDKVSPERIEAMNRDLIDLIQDTPQYKANIVQRCNADKSHLCCGQLLLFGE